MLAGHTDHFKNVVQISFTRMLQNSDLLKKIKKNKFENHAYLTNLWRCILNISSATFRFLNWEVELEVAVSQT